MKISRSSSLSFSPIAAIRSVRHDLQLLPAIAVPSRLGSESASRTTSEGDFKMQKHILGLTTSAFILACGAIPASAQQEPLTQQQPQILQQQEELQRPLQGVQPLRRAAEDESDQDDNGHGGGGRMMGSWHHRDWSRGAMGPGMMGRGGMMGFPDWVV